MLYSHSREQTLLPLQGNRLSSPANVVWLEYLGGVG